MNTVSALIAGGVLIVGGVLFLGWQLTFETAAPPTVVASEDVRMPPIPLEPRAASDTSSAHASDDTHVSNTELIDVANICTATPNDFDCYEKHYQDLVKSESIAAAFADLKSRYARDPYVKSQCHPLTHVIGRSAAEMFSNVSEAYKYGDGFCWSGYYHGILETFLYEGGVESIHANINTMCKDLNEDGKYGFNYYNCVHGLGHGLMSITENQLFDSLGYCDALTGSWEQNSCAGGAFMENVIVDGLGRETGFLDPARPLYPCSDSPDKYKTSCYLMQTSYMLKISGGDFSKVFAWCREAGGYTDTCFQSLGRDASGRSTSNGAQTKATCDLGANENEISNCVVGAVKDFISYFHSDTEGKAFCELYDGNVKTLCLDTARSYYAIF
jgi:hypothetical protein